MSLMVINKVDKKDGREKNLSVCILQKLCLQRLYKDEAIEEEVGVETTNGKKLMVMKFNLFKTKNGFN